MGRGGEWRSVAEQHKERCTEVETPLGGGEGLLAEGRDQACSRERQGQTFGQTFAPLCRSFASENQSSGAARASACFGASLLSNGTAKHAHHPTTSGRLFPLFLSLFFRHAFQTITIRLVSRRGGSQERWPDHSTEEGDNAHARPSGGLAEQEKDGRSHLTV